MEHRSWMLPRDVTPFENGETASSTEKRAWREVASDEKEQGLPVFKQFDPPQLPRGMDSRSQPPNTYLITSAEAKKQIKELSEAIFANRDKIRHILNTKEAALRKKWGAWKPKRKEKFLQAAWPEIPRRKYPHLKHFLECAKAGKIQSSTSPDCETINKWPYLDLENLSHANNLPLLLNSRGRNNPDVFAFPDSVACRLGLATHQIKTAWLPKYTMMFIGQDTPETYGALVQWQKDSRALTLGDAGVHFSVETGMLTLEVQSKIYDFLLECCHKLYSDTPLESLLSSQLPQQPEPTRIELSGTDYLDLAALVAQAPYRSPATLDTYRLAQLLDAKRAAAEDHAWSMIEDPGYFRDILLERSLHRLDQIPDFQRRKDANVDTEKHWKDAILEEVDCTFYRFLHLDILSELAKALHNAVSNNFEGYNHQEPLPQNVEILVLHILMFAAVFAQSFRTELSNAVPASKEIGIEFYRPRDEQGKLTPFMRKRNPLPKGDDLMVMLEYLFNVDRLEQDPVGIEDLVGQLQNHINDNPKQARRFSPFVSCLFAELAFVTELLRLLGSLYPWASSFQRKISNPSHAIVLPQNCLFNRMRQTINKANAHPVGAAETRLFLPITKAFHYPIDKAYNERNIDSLRQAEWNLDCLWKQWDCFFYEDMGMTLTDILRKHSKVTRVIHRTLPFCPRKASEVPRTIPEGPKITLTDYAPEPEHPGRFIFEAPRVKPKTRGALNAGFDADEDVDAAADAPTHITVSTMTKVQFRLKARDLKVFHSLFFSKDSGSQAGELDFKDFRHAMKNIGFGMEKLYGSVWHFKPDILDVNKSFHIHEPHPDGKFTFVMARNIGRRLTHTYGWTGGDFGEIIRGGDEELPEAVEA